jgi:hypothetical protein
VRFLRVKSQILKCQELKCVLSRYCLCDYKVKVEQTKGKQIHKSFKEECKAKADTRQFTYNSGRES